jgi:16S rRNA (cytidine1402-2'-O)-methyltransferase
VLERLQKGDRIALLSDAGAPNVSDPGGRIVEAVVAEELAIEVIPGPSAVVAALMGAGLITHRFAFLGFLPKKGKEREKAILDARRAGFALVIYESPLRIAETLDDLFGFCGPVRVVVARELTKHFETFHRGSLGSDLSPPLIEKGEMVIVVEAGELPSGDGATRESEEAEAFEKMSALIAQGTLSTKEGARRLARALHIPSRKAYERLITLSK